MNETDYYSELIRDITALKNAGHCEEAFFLVQKELALPYVPKEAETRLKELQRDLVYARAETCQPQEPSFDELLEDLNGSKQRQLAAAASLTERNLRNRLAAIADWLAGDPFPEAAALIIEALKEQGIDGEFVYNRDGVEYAFASQDVIVPAASGGVIKGLAYLRAWFSDDSPVYYEMTRRLLIHEAYMFLPLSYDAEEGLDLALLATEEVSRMMDDGKVIREIKDRLAEQL